MQGQEAKSAKANKLDLIFQTQHPIKDYQGLKNEFYTSGNVYLGGKEAVCSQCVYEKCIGAIVTVMDKKSYEKEKIKESIAELGLEGKHLHIEVKDNKEEKISPFFKEAQAFIEQAIKNEENVLVHCKGGMSRSPAILCSFMMRKFKLSFDEAYKILRERRNVVDINAGFQKELKEYQTILLGK